MESAVTAKLSHTMKTPTPVYARDQNQLPHDLRRLKHEITGIWDTIKGLKALFFFYMKGNLELQQMFSSTFEEMEGKTNKT